MDELSTKSVSPAVKNNVLSIVADITTAPSAFAFDGVRYFEYSSTDYFRGTAAALIKAGLITESMLPGQPGNKKTVSRIAGTNPHDPIDGHICIRKVGPRTFSVQIGISPSKRAQRLLSYEKKTAEFNALRSGIINNADMFREEIKDFATTAFRVFDTMMFNSGERYKDKHPALRYVPDVRERLMGRLDSIWSEMSKLIDEGAIMRDSGAAKPRLHVVKSSLPR